MRIRIVHVECYAGDDAGSQEVCEGGRGCRARGGVVWGAKTLCVGDFDWKMRSKKAQINDSVTRGLQETVQKDISDTGN